MEDFDRALTAYDSALRQNPYSVPAISAIASVHRSLDRFGKAVEFFQKVLQILPENGETWGAMGHCYLMMDELQKAYTAYQQALYHLPNPKEPKLWYGIGILYDRYGSLEHAEEAFASVVRMDPNYEKANEIYFRLGIIYKQQNKFEASLECFRYILTNPPRPLTEVDIWFQIGHVYEQQKDFASAKDAYEKVLAENPSHAKVLQQLGWLYHQSNAGFQNQERAIQFLTKSLESDPNDSQSWYLLGRAYMAGQNYNKAYEAYQQAVYRDGKNPTFWCSIGVLYYQINQFRDALDAYSRAIRLNPYISEVWFDLGSLYESCNNQLSDAIDAYARAADLDPENSHIQQRLMLLRNAEAKGEQVSSAPTPQDVHPTAYANAGAPGPPSQISGGQPSGQYPPGPAGPPLTHGGPLPGPPGDVLGGRELPGPGQRSPGPEHELAPPSIPNIDDRGMRGPSQTPFAPMEAPPVGSARTSPTLARAHPHARDPRDSPRYHHPHAAPYEDHRMSMDPYGRPMPPLEREREGDWGRGGPPLPPPHHHGMPMPDREEAGRYGNGHRWQSRDVPPPGMYERGAPYPPPSTGGPPGLAPPRGSSQVMNGSPSGPYDPLDRNRPLRQSDGSSSDREAGDAVSKARKGGRKSKGDMPSPAPRNRKAVDSPRAQSPMPGARGRGAASKPGTNPGTPKKAAGLDDANGASFGSSRGPLGSEDPAARELPAKSSVPPSRKIDEDYDEGAADALLGLASAASASAAMPPKPTPPAQPASPPAEKSPSPQVQRVETAGQGGEGAVDARTSAMDEDDASLSQQEPRAQSPSHEATSTDSLLGKRPAAENSEAADDTESRPGDGTTEHYSPHKKARHDEESEETGTEPATAREEKRMEEDEPEARAGTGGEEAHASKEEENHAPADGPGNKEAGPQADEQPTQASKEGSDAEGKKDKEEGEVEEEAEEGEVKGNAGSVEGKGSAEEAKTNGSEEVA